MSQTKVRRVHLRELVQINRLGLVAVKAKVKQDPDLLDPEVNALEGTCLCEDGSVVDVVQLLHVVLGQVGQVLNVAVVSPENWMDNLEAWNSYGS